MPRGGAGKGRPRGRPLAEAPLAVDAIKRASLAEFARHGFQSASIAGIAAKAGVAKALMHYHFSTKEVLWQAAVAEAFDRLGADLAGIRASTETLARDEIFDDLARKLVAFVARYADLVRIVLDESNRGGVRAQWLLENYQLPSLKAAQAIVTDLDQHLRPGQPPMPLHHLIPMLMGAISFPFLDAGAQNLAFGIDVNSDAYVAGHGEFVAAILKSTFLR